MNYYCRALGDDAFLMYWFIFIGCRATHPAGGIYKV